MSRKSRDLAATPADFIDQPLWLALLSHTADPGRVRDTLAKSMAKEPLSVEETATLLAVDDPQLVDEMFDAARSLKRDIYGNRIVLFAPLYIGNECTNDCVYCAFRSSNRMTLRRSLNQDEIREQVVALLDQGHKRLILVFGEHPRYDAKFIADCTQQVYATGTAKGTIRRVNINAAPLDHAGYRMIKDAGIGTYQVFQETYHRATYARVHPAGTRKSDFSWRLHGLSRAIESGLDDVGIGALFGLYDWRFEVLGLVAHAIHLQQAFGVGPHTISFPRLRPANGVTWNNDFLVRDEDFKRLVAILRLAVPYTGLILTAREPASIRSSLMDFGVSQIDAGSRIEMGGYTESIDGSGQSLCSGQFQLGDHRSLDQVMRELVVDGHVPSFCTACYRLGRTGEHFMEFAIPGFIQNMCTPNALTTLMEYLVDYASPETRAAGQAAIRRELDRMPDDSRKQQLLDRLRLIQETDERDLFS